MVNCASAVAVGRRRRRRRSLTLSGESLENWSARVGKRDHDPRKTRSSSLLPNHPSSIDKESRTSAAAGTV